MKTTLLIVLVALWAGPAMAEPAAPPIDEGVYSFAVDVALNGETAEIRSVEIVPGAARAYGSHPDQFRVGVGQTNGETNIVVRTFDPRWQRLYSVTSGDPVVAQPADPIRRGRPGGRRIRSAGPVQPLTESWQLRAQASERYFLTFRPDVAMVFVEWPRRAVRGRRPPPVVRFDVSETVSQFCADQPEACRRR